VTTAGNLVVECLSDNRVVLRWCHRCVALVASRRYRREIDDIKAAHHDISCLFLETWLGGKLPPPPPTTTTTMTRMAPTPSIDITAIIRDVATTKAADSLQRTQSLAVSPLAADRHVAPQPLLFSGTAYNLRRLSELWYQLLNAGEPASVFVKLMIHFVYSVSFRFCFYRLTFETHKLYQSPLFASWTKCRATSRPRGTCKFSAVV